MTADETTGKGSSGGKGHSAGGQMVGLAPNNQRITALLAVAAQDGYYGLWDAPRRYLMAALWHVLVPVAEEVTSEEAAAATRAIAARAERLDPALATTAFIVEDRAGKVFLDSTRAGGATVVAVYSPRIRPGAPVSFPVAWDDLDSVSPADFTVHTAAALVADGDPWAELMPGPQSLSPDLVEEGRAIPIARVQAMHEGKRRARARRSAEK